MEEKIAEMQAQIKDLKEQINRERIKADAYKNGLDIGSQIAAMKAGLMEGGLDENFAEKFILEGLSCSLKTL